MIQGETHLMTRLMLRPATRAEIRPDPSSELRVAYLTNVYPKISHSFIRTEIAALERMGIAVERFTIRHARDLPRDGEDRAEARRTTALLDGNRVGAIGAAARYCMRRPSASTGAFAMAMKGAGARGGGVREWVKAVAYWIEAAALAREMDRRDVRHVHVHFGTNPLTVARLARRLSGISYSFTVHGPDEFDAPRALELREKIADAAFVAGVSSFGRGQLMRWANPADWDRIAVVRCAVAPRFLHDSEPVRIESNRRLLCVARLSAQKGLPLLIEAVARMDQQQPFTLDIIGDGEERADIEAQIERLGLGQRVRLLGWRHADAVQDELSRARAFVLPSFAEGLPVVLMEAMAVGRPVIATAIAGVPELVDAQTGWLVPSGSSEALADAMQAALDAPDSEVAAMGRAGRERVLAMHDPDRNARSLAALLSNVLTEARAGSS